MVNKSAIARNLSEINSRYNKSRRPRDPLYFSKLALIELCGWIEVTMDSIVLHCAKRYLREAKNLEFVQERIQKTYSFIYESHFRAMLMNVFRQEVWSNLKSLKECLIRLSFM